MAKRKAKFDAAVERATLILQEHFDLLPPEEAKQKREEFRRAAMLMGRGSRGKASGVRRTSATRRKSRPSAKHA